MSHDMSDNEVDRVSLSDQEQPENPEDDNNKDDSGGEGRRIDPSTSKKRIIRRTIPKLNLERLKGPKGVISIEKYFEGFKFHNKKGHEKEDLERVMKRLEHWAHRLFPKYDFDDFLEKVEALGSKREIQTYLTKYRKDMLTDDLIMEEDPEDLGVEREKSPEPVDEFDKLIAEQIERTKQASSQLSKVDEGTGISGNRDDEEIRKRMEINRQIALERKLAKMREKNEGLTEKTADVDESSQTIEETGSINSHQAGVNAEEIDNEEEEIKKRIEKNRQIALERKLARMKQKQVERTIQTIPELSNDQRTLEKLDIPEDNGNETVEDIISHYKCANNGEKLPGEDTKDVQMEIDENPVDKVNNSEILNVSSSVINESTSSKKKMTDKELDKEIGDAVNRFMKGHR